MSHWPQSVFWRFIRFASRLRYRVEVEGLDEVRGLGGPTLIMPNHPAYIDPVLVLSHLRLDRPIRPVAISYLYRNPALYPIMRLMDAMEVPDLEEQSGQARKQTLAMIDAVVAGLERGETFLIYPSGGVQSQGYERVGAKRAVADILARCPSANLVLVRTRGLWGSMFSWAPAGNRPNLGRCLLRALGWTLASLVFFMPRRRVTMTVERVDPAELPGIDREQLNPFLEAWYNRPGPETPRFVPYHPVFGSREFAFPERAASEQIEAEKIRPATIRTVNEIVSEQLGRPLADEEKQPQTTLDELGLDSIAGMDLALRIEERFGFHSDQVATTLGELWALAEGQVAGGEGIAGEAPPEWNRPSPAGPTALLGDTLLEVFFRRALAGPNEVAAADRVSGVLSYRKLLVGTHLMSKRLRQLPGNAAGVLLPASMAADLVFFALHLAGKLPVMLNWTTGPANLAHAVRQLEVRHVVTSRKVVDRLHIEIEGAEYVFLEDLRAGIGKLEAAAAMAKAYAAPHRLAGDAPKANPDDPAVVLFTSGSESAPKAVPLTHRNLISNARAGLAAIQATRSDVLLGLLPPFHSFGLLAGILAPVLGGMRVVHHPDPTDARGLVGTAARYGATMIFTTPTFLGHMLSVAQPEDLRTLRIVVTGAEKCPESVFERAAQLVPQAQILEGYGITECSPVVSANPAGRIKRGSIGLPLEGVEVRLVDPETRRPIPLNTGPGGATGMLLVHGPSVFPGYLKYDGPSPFVELDGKRWYVTGDLVRIDEDGYLWFQGRLKRFLKAGGEMISLPALEEPLARLYPPTENGPQVAVEGLETPGGRWIVLFTTTDLSLRQANAMLSEAGMRGILRLDEVVRLDSIPVLGTGKTDYRRLRAMIAERMQTEKR